MDDKVFQAALAGLLHDVGKFGQRAGELGSRTWDGEAERDYKYQHALYSGDFVEKYVPKQWAKGLSGPARHHRPQTPHDRVVALADQLSAGERADERKDHPRQLHSIFGSITGLKDEQGQPIPPPAAKYLPLKRLAVEKEVIFPVDMVNDSHGTYKELWDEFEAEARALKTAFESEAADREAYLNSLLDLMQRYTWCIPSAYYRSVPDVSLYDHSRMTAALAACLAEQAEAKVQAWLDNKIQNEPVALLVGGDISGVQDFIYTITSAGAAKSLRGRSFYLQLLTEAVARYVLDQLGLPLTNIIYAGGGNFFLLAKPTQAEKLREIASQVTRRLLIAHDGALHLILSGQHVNPAEFKRNNFHQTWNRLHEELNKAKLKPLGDLADCDLAQAIGTGLGEGGDKDRLCNICGREVSKNEPMISDESGGAPVKICGICDSLAELGNKLVKATHIVTVYSRPPAEPDRRVTKWWQGLENFGMNVWLIDTTVQMDHYMSQLPDHSHLIELNTLPKQGRYINNLDSELKQTNLPLIKTFRLVAQLVAIGYDHLPLTFDELAQNRTDQHNVPTPNGEKRWSGLKRWGVLRMDVDNLGKLFKEGFDNKQKTGAVENNLTLSRLASLSFSLRLFFEGWLPQLGHKPEASDRLINRVYLQYAGGDDLFLVGSWDALPEFATAIQKSFTDYVCHHSAITVSGGVTLAAEKYPLYQAATDAEQAEKAAKNYRKMKNAFCFLSQPVGWEEFGQVMPLAYNLAEWCGDDNLVSRALLQTLLSIHAEYRAGRDEAMKNGKWKLNQIYYGAWMWHLAYQLGRRVQELNRRIENKNTAPEVREKLVEIVATLKQLERDMLDNRKIEIIGLAARWAQYLIRK